MTIGALEQALRARRDAGSKLLIPYVTGGLGPDWVDVVRAIAAAGADAIEIGIPFSDPIMDGPVIQRASVESLRAGTTPTSVITALAGADAGVPLAVMTYYNIVLRAGHRRMARTLADAGIAGSVVPDLPIDELDDWDTEAVLAGVESVLLVAPTTPKERLRAICARSRGFVYGVGLMGVTGERTSLSASALEVSGALQGGDRHTGAHRGRRLHAAAGSRSGGCRGRGRYRVGSRAPPARGRRTRRGGGVRRRVPGSDRQLNRS